MKVLMVDDDTAFTEQTEIFLQHIDSDIEVETVTSSERALEILEESDFDAVVWDYLMPGKNGLDCLKVLREEKNSDIPFIMFTGRGSEKIAMHALNLGADMYITKQGDPREKFGQLAESIKQVVECSQRRASC
ncbi:MAG: response regulator [Thermoplasmata archaeon]